MFKRKYSFGIPSAYLELTIRCSNGGASSVVELHFNSFNSNAFGTETLYDNDTNSGSKAWAQSLQDAMVDVSAEQGRATVGLKKSTPEFHRVSASDPAERSGVAQRDPQ